MFFFQKALDFAFILIEPVLVVSAGCAEDFQGRRVNCIPEGRPLLSNTVGVLLEVLEFAFHVVLEFFSILRSFQFGCVEFAGCFLSLGPSLSPLPYLPCPAMHCVALPDLTLGTSCYNLPLSLVLKFWKAIRAKRPKQKSFIHSCLSSQVKTNT